ncbi:MAG: hypothetical protein OHK0017_12810 [Patescibacteria group bacterium]
MLRNFLLKLYQNAVADNYHNLTKLAEVDKNALLVDLGCDDGTRTMEYAEAIGTSQIFGIEIVDSRAKIAESKGIKIGQFDLNSKFKIDDAAFDVVYANQVIEHLTDSDNFLNEVYRILKPGGYAVISTENASSWANVFASIMGWQIFSLTNFSNRQVSIGNPLALHRAEVEAVASSWNHVRIYNIWGLKEYFQKFDFEVEQVVGAGYFPFPGFLAKFDVTHSHFITFKIRRPRI